MILLAALSIVLTPAQGDDWIVDDDDGTWRTHHTIQDAINQSAAGDNITVYAGTYHEDLVVNQTVHIFGNGSGETIINGSESADAVTVSSNHVNITGVSVNASSTTNGITVNALYLTVDNCSISNCSEGIYATANWGRYDNITFTDCEFGARYYMSSRHYMRESTFENIATASIKMFYSERNTFRECVFDENGIEIEGYLVDHYEHHTIVNCRIAGPGWKAIVNYERIKNHTHSWDNIGQLIMVKCDNVTIENTDFERGGWSVIVAYSKNIIFRNLTLANATTGFDITDSNNITFRNISIDGMTDRCIYATGSPNCVIDGVNVTDSKYGFWTTNGGGYSIVTNFNVSDSYRAVHCFDPHVTVENSTFIGCEHPVYVWAHNFTMRHCLINDTSKTAFYLRSSNSLYENNTIRDGSGRGFYLTDPVTYGNEIIYNEFFGNYAHAVWMRNGANNNTVHHNNFANNDQSPQCHDDGVDNTWDDGTEGNYWDDWNGTGNYTLTGTANSADEHPLGSPVDNDAPQKVPEFGLLYVVSMVLVAAVLIRRRRK